MYPPNHRDLGDCLRIRPIIRHRGVWLSGGTTQRWLFGKLLLSPTLILGPCEPHCVLIGPFMEVVPKLTLIQALPGSQDITKPEWA